LTVLLMLAALPAGARAQYSPKRTEQIAREYNQAVTSINDRIDELRGKANDPNLSMSGAARLIDQQSELRRQADRLWSNAQSDVTGAFRKTGEAIDRYNAENRRLDFQSAIAGSQIDLLNNVAQNPTREQFDQKKDELSRQWEQTYGSRLKPFGDDFAQEKASLFKRVKDAYSIDLNQTGYSRIGTINPYTGETYYKYYGPDGNLVAGQWKDDANGWSKWREDVNTSIRRQRDWGQQLERESADLNRFNGQLEQNRAATQGQLSSLETQVRHVDFSGKWSGRDSDGDTIQLSLYADGTMLYVERLRSDGSVTRNWGSWEQNGRAIYMGNNAGDMKWSGRVLSNRQLEISGRNSYGKRWVDYLSR
jgi:hypothetical protein